MTDGGCLNPQALADRRAWPKGDPRQRHLDGCPRCRALVASYDLFMEPADDLPPERLEAARRRLEEARREWMSASSVERAELRDRGSIGEWLRRGFAPRLARPVPALAAAGAAIVVVAAFLIGRYGFEDRHPEVLRRESARPSAEAPRLLESSYDGPRILLRWRPAPGAEAYEVTLLDAGLTPLARVPAGTDTALAVAVGEWAAGDPAATSAAPRYWVVTARLSGGGTVESPPMPLPAPPGR